MLKRFINKMLFTSTKYRTICFTKDDSINGKFEVNYDTDESLIQVLYRSGILTSDLATIREIEVIEDIEVNIHGCFDLLPIVVNNNVEYVQGEVVVKNICQYLVADSKLRYSGAVLNDSNFCIAIRKSDIDAYYMDPVLEEGEEDLRNIIYYCDFINKYNIVYAHKYVDPDKYKVTKDTDDKIRLVNIHFCPFDNQRYTVTDESIAGLVEEFAINDVRVMANFVRVLQKKYPEIQFYTNAADRSSDYKEWIHYSFTNRPVSSRLFHNRVMYSHIYGKRWHTTIDFSLEYQSVDLPTLLARRDQYTVHEFLCKVHYFKVKFKDDDIDIDEVDPEEHLVENSHYINTSTDGSVCALFWDRNELSDEFNLTTQQDITGYSVPTYMYTGRILFCNIQFSPRPVSTILEAVCKLIVDSHEHNVLVGEVTTTAEVIDEEKSGSDLTNLQITTTSKKKEEFISREEDPVEQTNIIINDMDTGLIL